MTWSRKWADPVILIGVRVSDGALGAVGLYTTAEDANRAVVQREVPTGYYYSVMTPAMGSTGEFRKFNTADGADKR